MKGHDVFELLAPAGSFEILKAVIFAGADAVYVGGDRFGARAYANNFSQEELLEAIDFVHLHGKKIYLTVNTLLKNNELNHQLYDYLLPFYKQGLDAVLVQDFGVMQYIKQVFPKLPIHISTQMTVTGADGVRFLAKQGASRVVLSRELSITEMKKNKEETGVELEVFVHGALCYSYSGQCLLSSMLGGRSGNRGRCAQPCRLMYSVYDEEHHKSQNDCYPISLKDLCGLTYLKQLHEAGVYSLKIEGRMKQVEYAAGVVKLYRKYIDLFGENKQDVKISKQDEALLFNLGNRCGFTSGYYEKQNGTDMITMKKPSYEKQQNVDFCSQESRLSVKGYLRLRKNQQAEYTVYYREYTANVLGMEVSQAQKKPLQFEDVLSRMKKTGDTPFIMDDIVIEMEEDVFLPNGVINQLRREALEKLKDAILSSARRDVLEGSVRPVFPLKPFISNNQELSLICLTQNRALLDVLCQNERVTEIYLDAMAYQGENWILEMEEDIALCHKAHKRVLYVFPRIFREAGKKRYEKNRRFFALDFDGFVAANFESLSFVKRSFPTHPIVLDQGMYTYNDLAVEAYQSVGVIRNTVPFELNQKEIRHRENSMSEMVVYGYYPLMTSAQCLMYQVNNEHKPAMGYLKDRYKKEFPIRNNCMDCYSVIYNSLPTMLFSKLSELKSFGISSFRLDFSIETKEMAKQVLDLFHSFVEGKRTEYPPEWKEKYTNGHYQRGVE